jgi:mortality factor 4-like protein 1
VKRQRKAPTPDVTAIAGSNSNGNSNGPQLPARSKSRHSVPSAPKGRDYGTTQAQAAGKITLAMPPILKHYLVQDFDEVTNNVRLLKLPVVPSVSTVVDEWVATTRAPVAGAGDRVPAFSAIGEGVKHYFAEAVGTMLLYKLERQQYNDLVRCIPSNAGGLMSKKLQSHILHSFGAIHLLRFITKMPVHLPAVPMAEGSDVLVQLKSRMEDLLAFMLRHHARIFSHEYQDADEEYNAAMVGAEVVYER